MRKLLSKAIAFISLFVFISCATVNKSAEESTIEVELEVPTYGTSQLLNFEELSYLRSTIDQPFITGRNEISTVFSRLEDDLPQGDTNNGFRIQLLSTQDIQEAERISLAYYDWALDQKLKFSRIPEAYVLFRQPNYRVRIGDFKSREQAISFLNTLRPHFPGAWIVMDTIDPELIPSETP